MITLTSRTHRWPGFLWAVAALVAAAWAILTTWAASPYARLLDHRSLGEQHLSLAELVPLFGLGWTLMTLAMMLPASINPLRSYLAPVPAGRHRGAFLVRFIVGYISVWLAFGLLAYLGDNALHELVETGAVPGLVADRLLAGVLLIAGLYQFTPAKRAFLTACLPDSDHADLQPDVPGQRGLFWPGLRQGLRQSLACLGSCWSLMLVMFALGGVQLGWMAALTAIMTVESGSPAGSRLREPLGLALIAWAVLLLVI